MVLASAVTSAPARATPTFPGVVKDHYMLAAVPVDPPLGCMLCHTTDVGGASQRPFGLLLSSQYGVRQNDEGSLKSALSALDAQGSKLSQDLRTGIDPNIDVTNDPTPLYGCGVMSSPGAALAAAPAEEAGRSLAAVLVPAVVLFLRRRRSNG
jgi:hypothetical protein